MSGRSLNRRVFLVSQGPLDDRCTVPRLFRILPARHTTRVSLTAHVTPRSDVISLSARDTRLCVVAVVVATPFRSSFSSCISRVIPVVVDVVVYVRIRHVLRTARRPFAPTSGSVFHFDVSRDARCPNERTAKPFVLSSSNYVAGPRNWTDISRSDRSKSTTVTPLRLRPNLEFERFPVFPAKLERTFTEFRPWMLLNRSWNLFLSRESNTCRFACFDGISWMFHEVISVSIELGNPFCV